jgi:hypothetical protein
MSCYVIGIGGTGAKCVEALIHLCAAGLMPDRRSSQGEWLGREELYVAFVDPDTNNGSLDRARETLGQYAKCGTLKLGETDLFKTQINFVPEHVVWSPFANDARPRLDSFFRYNALGDDTESVRHLFDVLFSREEKETTLEKGFRGHPSIGAAVLASTLNLGEEQPWRMLRERIKQDVGASQDAKIILVGSIFGGTGAAGLPTIARLIRNEFGKDVARAKIGGVLVLPYFSFDTVTDEGMRADSENFLLSTQAALKYYHQQAEAGRQMDLDVFNAVYTVGEAELSRVKTASLGSKDQRNEQHFIEMYAALAALDFFGGGTGGERYRTVARASAGRLVWDDLPFTNAEQLKVKIRQLTRFAFAYLSSYYPMLKDIERRGKAFRAPWYINLVERANVPREKVSESGVEDVHEYCESYLLWLAHIVASANNINTELIDYNAFAEKQSSDDGKTDVRLREEFDIGKFSNLILPARGVSEGGLNELWSRMSGASVTDPNAVGMGRFFRALYDECGR